MGQLGFFDADKRLAALSAKGDPLEAIDRLVPWESFRVDIEAVVLTPEEMRKSSAGRKPLDAIVMFRMLVLQALNNLSDEQAEYQVRDRLSFTRFLRLGIEDSIPDATTLWLFREKLAKAGLIEKLFDRFDPHLAAKGYMARGGQMVDATIVPVPTQRNSRDENEAVKAGRIPQEWYNKPAKLRQKDRDARWTKRHGRSFFGYKNHVNADAKAQADPALRGDRCGGARQSEAGRTLDQGQHVGGRVRRQRLSLTRGRGATARRRLQEPYSCAGHSQTLALGSASECEPQQKQNSRPRRARVRSSTDRAGRPDRTRDRHRASARQNWLAEPGLQHSPPCDAGADRRRMRVESTSGKHAERRTDKRAPRWAINATNYRPALVAITRRTGIVRGALVGSR